MTQAPGVSFNEEKHTYWYKGKRLSGVTGLIAKKLGLKYSDEYCAEHLVEGIHVHKAVQKWFETGDSGTVHTGVQWLIDTFWDRYTCKVNAGYSEVLVSDLKEYASAVDIIVERGSGEFDLFDIKKGKFNRDYVTWQLSIYKYFIERYGGREIRELYCICLRDREYYTIFPKSTEQVEKLLYG